jgi:hypothetical protein
MIHINNKPKGRHKTKPPQFAKTQNTPNQKQQNKHITKKANTKQPTTNATNTCTAKSTP